MTAAERALFEKAMADVTPLQKSGPVDVDVPEMPAQSDQKPLPIMALIGMNFIQMHVRTSQTTCQSHMAILQQSPALWMQIMRETKSADDQSQGSF